MLRATGYRRLALAAALTLLISVGVEGSQPGTGTPWYDVTDIQDAIYGHKKEIELSAEKASRVFKADFPQLQERWRDELEQPIEPRPGSGGPPQGFVELPEGQRTERAVVVGFSSNEIAVMVLRPTGYWLWHHFSECLAAFRIRRNPQLDALFGVGDLERRYAVRYKGVGYGDTDAAVRAAFGAPDAIEEYQPFNYFRFSYLEDDLVFQFQDARVKTITRGVPATLREEIKQKGRHITRY